MRPLLAPLLITLGIVMACESSAQSPSDPFKDELTAYFECNAKGASEAWRLNGHPVTLAHAVVHQCKAEEIALGEAMKKSRTDSFAQDMLLHARKTVVEQSTATIVKNRAYYLLKRRDRNSI